LFFLIPTLFFGKRSVCDDPEEDIDVNAGLVHQSATTDVIKVKTKNTGKSSWKVCNGSFLKLIYSEKNLIMVNKRKIS
jgi:hypothetical protein